ncbi:MAG: hypothetical protein HYV09_07005 [Deltaproteobacteria bacterium]|nr:hypothetical protein [Deltaproteobacteria bacterium]
MRLPFAFAIALAVGSASAAPVVADRAVARFNDPEASDAKGALRFVMMRELVLEAWLVAYERAPAGTPAIDDKTLRIALDRHVIEAVLGSRTLPLVYEARVDKAATDARNAEVLAVGGEERFRELLTRATGSAAGGAAEIEAVLRRRARTELYLESAVGLTFEPNEGELHAAHGKIPAVAGKSFEEVAAALRAYLRTLRFREGAQAYHQAVRSKLRLEIVPET